MKEKEVVPIGRKKKEEAKQTRTMRMQFQIRVSQRILDGQNKIDNTSMIRDKDSFNCRTLRLNIELIILVEFESFLQKTVVFVAS